MINTDAEDIAQTVVEISLLLGAGKRNNLCCVEVDLELFLPGASDGRGRIISELRRFKFR